MPQMLYFNHDYNIIPFARNVLKFKDVAGFYIKRAIFSLKIPTSLITEIVLCVTKGDFIFLKYSAVIRTHYCYIYLSNFGRGFSFIIANLGIKRKDKKYWANRLSVKFLISNFVSKQINELAIKFHYLNAVKYLMYFE